VNIAESFIASYPKWSAATVLDLQNVLEFCESLYKQNTDRPFFTKVWKLPCRPPWAKTIGWVRWQSLGDGQMATICESNAQKMAVTFLATKAGQEHTMGAIEVPLDSQGCPVAESDVRIHYPIENPTPEQQKVGRETILTMAEWFLAAMSFCHCRNVRIEKVPISRQVRRHAERKGEPIIEHHHLVIEPMRQVLIKEGGLHEHGDLARAMHICRGHFVHYGEKFGKGKLFGKYEGQFWLPQHVRGSLDKGVITKDYAICLPKQ